MADLGDRITRELTVRYIAVLAVLGFATLLSFIGLAQVVGELDGSAERINLAGRQRMLVERTAFAANRLVVADAAERAETSRILTASLNHLEERHARLLYEKLPADVVSVLFDPPWRLDADIRTFIAHGRDLARRKPPIATDDIDLLAISAAASQPLLDRLDELTIRLQRYSQTMIDRLIMLQGVSLAVVLGMLLLSAFGVFQPMVERLKSDIFERFRATQELRESEERLWRILEESPMGVSVSRRVDGRVVFANTRFTEILGMPKEEFIGSAARDLYVDETQRRIVLGALRRDGFIDDAEVEFRRKNGEAFWSLLTIRSTAFQRESVNLAWVYDITERKRAEQQILLAAKVLENVSEGVVITDAHNKIIFVNPAFSNITEYSRDDVLGENPKFLSSGRHDPDFYAAMWTRLRRNGNWSGEVWNRRKSGEFFAEWLSITMIRDAAGTVTHYIAVFTDITHRKEDEERVRRQANYDALTGLPNRLLFLDRLTQAVRQARREAKGFALMFLDLDGFKRVNDTLGHAAGDVLLQQTAVRLSECMRGSDTLARLAGDEFVIILQGIRGRHDPAIVAGKILDQLSRPYELEGGEAHIRGSIGIAMFPEDSESGEGLIKLADEAMYAVKRHGKNGFRFTGEPEASSSQSS